MSLEEAIVENTSTMKALIAQMKAGTALGGVVGKTPTVPGKPAAAGKPPAAAAAAKKPKFTFEQVSTAVMEIKDTISKDTARECIEGICGEGVKLAAVQTMPQHWDALVAKCKETMDENDEAPAEDPDDEV